MENELWTMFENKIISCTAWFFLIIAVEIQKSLNRNRSFGFASWINTIQYQSKCIIYIAYSLLIIDTLLVYPEYKMSICHAENKNKTRGVEANFWNNPLISNRLWIRMRAANIFWVLYKSLPEKYERAFSIIILYVVRYTLRAIEPTSVFCLPQNKWPIRRKHDNLYKQFRATWIVLKKFPENILTKTEKKIHHHWINSPLATSDQSYSKQLLCWFDQAYFSLYPMCEKN